MLGMVLDWHIIVLGSTDHGSVAIYD